MRSPRRPGSPVLAGIVLGASWLPAIASVILVWTFQLPDEPVERAFLSDAPLVVSTRFDDIGVTVALIYGAVSALLLARRPHPVAAILSVHAVGSGLAAFGVQWGLLGEQVPGLPLWGLLGHAAGWGFVPGTFATTIIPLFVLPGRATRGRRALIGLGLAFAAIATFLAITNQSPALPPNPFAIRDAGYQLALPLAYAVISGIAIALSALVAVLLVLHWRRAGRVERGRLGWLMVGHAFLTLSYASLVVPRGVTVPDWVWAFGMVAPVLGQAFYPAAVLVMVLGPRLWGIDVAVSRVLAAVIAAVAAAGGYLGLTAALSAAVSWPPPVIGILSAAVVAVAIQPGRSWLQRRVDRLVYPDGDPGELVRRLGERVGELDSAADGLQELVAGLRVALRAGSVTIASGRTPAIHARSGQPVGAAHVVELQTGGTVIGTLAATARPAERLSERTRRELEELSGIVAVALRLVEANEELESARDDVIGARQAERRSLRRELHDGIGPALAGIGFGLAAVDNLVDTDVATADRLAERLSADLRDRIEGVRELARGLRALEPVPDLAIELAGIATAFAGAGPEIVVDAGAARSVPAASRSALVRLTAEAVHNAVRHANARRIRVSLVHRESVVLEVEDDGDGFVPGAPGVGLSSMREHAAEADADFELDTLPGRGTIVRVSLPLDAARDSEEVPA